MTAKITGHRGVMQGTPDEMSYGIGMIWPAIDDTQLLAFAEGVTGGA